MARPVPCRRAPQGASGAATQRRPRVSLPMPITEPASMQDRRRSHEASEAVRAAIGQGIASGEAKGAYRRSHPSQSGCGYLALAGIPNAPEPGTSSCFLGRINLGRRTRGVPAMRKGPVQAHGGRLSGGSPMSRPARSPGRTRPHCLFHPVARGPLGPSTPTPSVA